MRIDIDGRRWFDGEASCVLVANVSTIVGGLSPFERAEPDDGVLEVGVVEAEGALQWARSRWAHGRGQGRPLAVHPHHLGPAHRREGRLEDRLRASMAATEVVRSA